MSLSTVYKAVKIIETIENYTIVENNALLEKEPNNPPIDNEFYDDKQFWEAVISNPEKYWNTKVSLIAFTISNWVARIPGLYWASYSKSLRKHAEKEIAKQSKQWIEFHPPGKSKKVLGGIGTILLPPNDEGKRLVSVSSGCNSSIGIPLLVFPNVWDTLKLKEGDTIIIKNAIWQPLDVSWSNRFVSTSGIPRGYIIADTPEKIKIYKRDTPIVYHPFSVMEYQKGDALLYDFVYLIVDNKIERVRNEIEDFFNYYAQKENRHGKYLINPNMIEPYFETQYTSPHEMQHQSEKAKLELIYKRIRDIEFNHTALNKLIETLPSYYDSSLAIKRLAKSVGVSPALLQEDNAASMSAQLINYCFDNKKIEELTDRMLVEYPTIFNT